MGCFEESFQTSPTPEVGSGQTSLRSAAGLQFRLMGSLAREALGHLTPDSPISFLHRQNSNAQAEKFHFFAGFQSSENEFPAHSRKKTQVCGYWRSYHRITGSVLDWTQVFFVSLFVPRVTKTRPKFDLVAGAGCFRDPEQGGSNKGSARWNYLTPDKR